MLKDFKNSLLFRGVSKENKNWVYGGLLINKNNYFIIPFCFSWSIESIRSISIYKETISRGLDFLDLNKKYLFEGDNITYYDRKIKGQVTGRIIYEENNWGINLFWDLKNQKRIYLIRKDFLPKKCIIVGSYYDNFLNKGN